jgi:hypothetical protein
VGVTSKSLRARLGHHIRTARCGERTERGAWVRSLLDRGLRPDIALVEETQDREREVFWISRFRAAGADLVNTTDGGRGLRGLSEEAARRRDEAKRTRVVTEETRAKLRAANLGRTISAETREKLRAAGRRPHGPMPDDRKAKISAAKMGHEVSPETRAKISATLTGRPTGRTRTHCPLGHAYTPENAFINKRGAQECRICRKARFRASYERRKAKGDGQ